MENSTMNLYIKSNSAELGEEDDQNSEESGWTAYFEDFLNEQNSQQYSENHCNSSFVTNSVVSDAASFIVEYDQLSNKDKVVACSTITSLPKFSKKLNFKKTRTIEISYDDSLEDTASSPVNSPRIMKVINLYIPFYIIHVIYRDYLFH